MRIASLFRIFALAGFVASLGGGTALARIDIKVDKAAQVMTVAVDGKHRYTWKVSTGMSGYTTPSGSYRPFRLEPDHFSQEWDNAPMPHSIFFTNRGHAIHGSYQTRRLGSPASKGCVRLDPRNAAMLYRLVEKTGLGRTTITISDRGTVVAGRMPPRKVQRTIQRPKARFGDWLQENRRR